jgi:hypothetical protein
MRSRHCPVVGVGADGGPAEKPIVDEAIQHAKLVYAKNADHPGALHYLIHAYDHPERAPQGLEVARAYAKTAPASEHALHMPSHIFVQLGLWDDAIASNKAAWAASRADVERRNVSPSETTSQPGLAAVRVSQQGQLRCTRVD